MWHEEQYEMRALISSLFNLFHEHKRLQINYYTLQTHIFIDDAFDEMIDSNGNKRFAINSYVKDLIDITKQINREFGYEKLGLTKANTPYGQQIDFNLGFEVKYKLIAHLKNRKLIRKGKRWSQVMYMNLAKNYVKGLHFESSDVFLIALDGDTSYPPKSVLNIIDSAIEKPEVAAISGKLVPICNQKLNWIVSYQKFEYSVSYWLQKTAENIWGTILCSPGCFTLYRAEAIFETMTEYSSHSTDAFTQILYGQGEDRWLTTLLTKAGWLIDYCPSAVAYTNSPTTMDEYIKQRLRWIASTMINNLHFILISRKVTKYSKTVSWIFVAYHSAVFLVSILAPGSVVLMLSGVYNSAFPISELLGFGINLSIFLIYCFICFYTKNNIQIIVMKIFGAVYGLTMIAVLATTIYQFTTDSFHSPTLVIFLSIAVVFTLAALLHPGDLLMSASLLPAFIYYVCGPMMLMLLPLYSLINMNVVSWGTREKPKSDDISLIDGFSQSQSDISNAYKNQYDFEETDLDKDESDLWKSLVQLNGALDPNQDLNQSQETKEFRLKLMTKQRNKYALISISINLIFILSLILIDLFLSIKMVRIVIPIVNYSLDVDPTGLTVFIMLSLFFVFQFISLLAHRYKIMWFYIRDRQSDPNCNSNSENGTFSKITPIYYNFSESMTRF